MYPCKSLFYVDEDEVSQWSSWTDWNECECTGPTANQQRRFRECISTENENKECEGYNSEGRTCVATNCQGENLYMM